MMQPNGSQTIEQALFERMGVSVDDAVATGMDVVDEKVAAAVESGINVDQTFSSLGQLLEKLCEPETLAALNQLLEQLPQLAQLATLANQIPGTIAMIADALDEFQQRYATKHGIDLDRAFSNGIQAALFMGSQVDSEHLQRIGELLGSDILNPHAMHVVDSAAKSLANSQQDLCNSKTSDRVGFFGLLSALRNPDIQRSLAFAIQFGKCFGNNLNNESK